MVVLETIFVGFFYRVSMNSDCFRPTSTITKLDYSDLRVLIVDAYSVVYAENGKTPKMYDFFVI